MSICNVLDGALIRVSAEWLSRPTKASGEMRLIKQFAGLRWVYFVRIAMQEVKSLLALNVLILSVS